MREKIQTIILEACAKISTKVTGPNETPETSLDDKLFNETNNLFGVEKNFESLFPSIVLFLEQDVRYNVTMNLDVNFQRLRQENLQQDHGSNIIGSIFDQDGKTFQNSPIHLIFYERVYDYKDDLLLTLKEKPKLSSMGWCQFNKKSVHAPPHLLNKELIFEYQGISAKWVTTEQYAQLLFILGLEETGSSGNSKVSRKSLHCLTISTHVLRRIFKR